MVTAPNTESVTVGSRLHRSVREGAAVILAPYSEKVPPAQKSRNNDEGSQAVFYNPIQQFNRDLSVLAILIYGEGAVVRKAEHLLKKAHVKNNRKERAKKPSEKVTVDDSPSVPIEANGGAVNSKKRKVDELDVQVPSDGNEEVIKKQKTTERKAEDDDEMEVRQLGNHGHDAEALQTSSKPLQDVTDGQAATDNTDKLSANGVAHSTIPNDASLKAQQVQFTILDALSATGLRALRYAKEIPFATNIVANDLSPDAVKSIEVNIDHNDVRGRVRSNVGDARAYMYSKVGNEQKSHGEGYVHRFDVIDLDPYGTAAPFLDAAVQSLQDGGLLCVTCTDAGVFASTGYLEKTYDLYGGIPLKGAHSHEGGLRLILHAVATSAAKYGIGIEPLLSLSIDFYARLFIRVHKQQKDVKLLAGTTMLVYSCDHGCGSWSTQLLARNQAKEDKNGDLLFRYTFAQAPSTTPTCEHCGFRTHLGGPMWAGPLHNSYFVQRILDRLPLLDRKIYGTLDRLEGMLTLALEEGLTLPQFTQEIESTTKSKPTDKCPSDPRIIPRTPPETLDPSPFFIIPNYLAKVLHASTPSEAQLRGALRHLGYRVTRSHCKPGSFRTTAPWSVLWHIFREWVRTKSPIKPDAVRPGTAGWEILGELRGSERKEARDFKKELLQKLEKLDDLKDVKTVLESAMYRLGQPGSTSGGGGNGEKSPTFEDAQDGRGMTGGGRADNRASLAAGTGDISNAAVVDVSKLEVVFDEILGKEKPRDKLVRYQVNPRANWGPMNRAGGNN